jgi:hypothetical protein
MHSAFFIRIQPFGLAEYKAKPEAGMRRGGLVI